MGKSALTGHDGHSDHDGSVYVCPSFPLCLVPIGNLISQHVCVVVSVPCVVPCTSGVVCQLNLLLVCFNHAASPATFPFVPVMFAMAFVLAAVPCVIIVSHVTSHLFIRPFVHVFVGSGWPTPSILYCVIVRSFVRMSVAVYLVIVSLSVLLVWSTPSVLYCIIVCSFVGMSVTVYLVPVHSSI